MGNPISSAILEIAPTVYFCHVNPTGEHEQLENGLRDESVCVTHLPQKAKSDIYVSESPNVIFM
jgi:hypothetical protein